MVGDAYICGDGFDYDNPYINKIVTNHKNVSFRSSSVGWSDSSSGSRNEIIGIPRNNWFDINLKYDFVFEPIILWAIEI